MIPIRVYPRDQRTNSFSVPLVAAPSLVSCIRPDFAGGPEHAEFPCSKILPSFGEKTLRRGRADPRPVQKTVFLETLQIGSMAASYQSTQNSSVLLFWSLSSTSNRGSPWSGRKRGSQRIKCTVPSGMLT